MGSKRILVVDDDQNYLGVIGDTLEEAGFEVDLCGNAVRVMEQISRQPVHCVLMDYHMPGLDGQDLLRLIRTQYPAIPVILCSGHSDMDGPEFIREGAFEVLHKPFDHQALLEVLRRALSPDEDKTHVCLKGYDLRKARETVTRKIMIKALTRSKFNITQAASMLGISRQYLIRCLKYYQIAH